MSARKASRHVFTQVGDDVAIAGHLFRTHGEKDLIMRHIGDPSILLSDIEWPDASFDVVVCLAISGDQRVTDVCSLRAGGDSDLLEVSGGEQGDSCMLLPFFYQQDVLSVLRYATQKGLAVLPPAAA